MRLEDAGGKPVAGVEVECSLGAVPWARLKSGATGCCTIAMARSSGWGFRSSQRGPRPIEMAFAIRRMARSITLPIIPLIRGRVVDETEFRCQCCRGAINYYGPAAPLTRAFLH